MCILTKFNDRERERFTIQGMETYFKLFIARQWERRIHLLHDIHEILMRQNIFIHNCE